MHINSIENKAPYIKLFNVLKYKTSYIRKYKNVCIEDNLDFSTLFQSPTGGSDDVSLGLVLIFFLIDIVLYMTLTIYLDNLFPGPYGVKKYWKYPIKVS